MLLKVCLLFLFFEGFKVKILRPASFGKIKNKFYILFFFFFGRF